VTAWDETAAGLLRTQLAHAFAAARWQVADLTDDEYFWEPNPGSWSVRRRGDAVSATPCGAGEWVIDGEWPLGRSAPFTTIGWRLVHLTAWTDIYCDWTFGTATLSYDNIDVPGDASAAVRSLSRSQDAFTAAVAAVDGASFGRERVAHWGETFPIGTLVWQIMVEHLHHSAEIGVLRDLRRGHGRTDAWPEPTTS
jgi:hypothetical protein